MCGKNAPVRSYEIVRKARLKLQSAAMNAAGVSSKLVKLTLSAKWSFEMQTLYFFFGPLDSPMNRVADEGCISMGPVQGLIPPASHSRQKAR